MKEARPQLTIIRTPVDNAVDLIGWLLLAGLWAIPLFTYPDLPASIPTHFNGAGQADSYGRKETILILPAVATLLLTGMSVLNRFPHLFNYPAPITAENARRHYTNATRLIRYLKVTVALVFSLIVFRTVQTATDRAEGLGRWFLPLALALIFLPILMFMVKSFNRRDAVNPE